MTRYTPYLHTYNAIKEKPRLNREANVVAPFIRKTHILAHTSLVRTYHSLAWLQNCNSSFQYFVKHVVQSLKEST